MIEMKNFLHIIFNKTIFLYSALLVQVSLMLVFIFWFSNYLVYFDIFCIVLSIIAVLMIIYDKSNPEYKISLIILIMLFPVIGGIFYLNFGVKNIENEQWTKMMEAEKKRKTVMKQSIEIFEKLQKESSVAVRQSQYIYKYDFSPIYENTEIDYLALGEVKYYRLLNELKKAKKYIFLEYFIIAEGKMWDSILEILLEKLDEGVDIRIIYDDLGSRASLPSNYSKKLNKMGLRCYVFNPLSLRLSMKMNSRDHRKICIIDGLVGFTGGINLGDEYINAYAKLGHWKDTAIRIKGEAVWSLTTLFLTTWEFLSGENEDYLQFLPEYESKAENAGTGFVQPFSDSPLDDELVGETVYSNLINQAEKYVYISSPYLIVGFEMIRILCTAAKLGIDVRIMTPHIGDKWYVHDMTRSHYQVLLEAGVKIFEYTPGFIHSKSFVVDDTYATIGSINLDFRSFNLNFECGVWMYKNDAIADMKEDFLQTQTSCKEITLEECQNFPWHYKFRILLLRIFSPLM